jgi:hypothetical protein
MFWDELWKLVSGSTLYRLDALIGGKLVPLLYGLGMAAIGLWAVDHLFASFAFNFGQGLWGVLEVLIYGALWFVALRIVCEAILVFFRSHDDSVAAVNRSRGRNTLAEDIGDAIRDLADTDNSGTSTGDEDAFTGSPDGNLDIDPPIRGTVPRRTAKRTPPKT